MVFTVVVGCPNKDLVRVWLLPVENQWFGDWWEPVVSLKSNQILNVYVETGAFAEFYPFSDDETFETLGEAGYRLIGQSDVEDFISALEELFKRE